MYSVYLVHTNTIKMRLETRLLKQRLISGDFEYLARNYAQVNTENRYTLLIQEYLSLSSCREFHQESYKHLYEDRLLFYLLFHVYKQIPECSAKISRPHSSGFAIENGAV